jgi:hypothetical protein
MMFDPEGVACSFLIFFFPIFSRKVTKVQRTVYIYSLNPTEK